MHRPRILLLGVVGAFAALIALAGAASAHVTVTAPGATRGGGDQEITFRVPVEKNVDTVGLTVALPTNTPIASVDVEPVPGWKHVQKSVTLAKPITTDDGDITTAVSQITWTAEAGQGLKPGEFGAFTIIAGQLPDTSSITFKALQTYADGSVVKWIEVKAPGATDDPEHPAPVLALAADTTVTKSSATAPAPSAPKATATKATSNTGPVVLSIVALVLAAAALGLAVVTRARGRAT